MDLFNSNTMNSYHLEELETSSRIRNIVAMALCFDCEASVGTRRPKRSFESSSEKSTIHQEPINRWSAAASKTRNLSQILYSTPPSAYSHSLERESRYPDIKSSDSQALNPYALQLQNGEISHEESSSLTSRRVPWRLYD
jgi:hypothetical protein